VKVFRHFYIALVIFCCALSTAYPQAQTNNHIIAAREYLKAGDHLKARLELDSAARLSPNNPVVNEMLGDIYADESRYARAIMNYDKAIGSNATNAALYMKRAELHSMLDNHRDYVLKDYNAAIQLEPQRVEYYKIKAEYLATHINPTTHKYDFSGASETINEAIAIDRSNPELHYLKSRYLANGELYLAALADINKAIALNNTNPEYFAQRGKIQFGITSYRNAYADFGRAISLDSTVFEYFENRAHTFYNMGNYVRAYEDYSIAIDMIISEIANKQGRIDSSDPLNKSLRLDLLYRGMTLVQDKRPYDGCDDFKRAYQMGEIKARNYMRKYCY
jgi:tetratricopeptide (TPR) repeat protein